MAVNCKELDMKKIEIVAVLCTGRVDIGDGKIAAACATADRILEACAEPVKAPAKEAPAEEKPAKGKGKSGK